MKLLSLQQLIGEYESALSFLESLGVNIKNTRLSIYLTLLRTASEHELAGDERHQQEERFRNAVIEASEIIDIARLDRRFFDNAHVLTKLRQVSAGRELFDSDGPDPARDYAFEFASAGELHALEKFGGFSTAAGDVLVAPGQWPIENKRISSLARVSQRVREARDQLQIGFESGASPGLIALDLSRPIRRAQGFLSNQTDHALVESTDIILSAYIGQHFMRAIGPGEIARPGVLGVMLRYVSAGNAGEVSSIRRSTAWQLVSVHPDESPENRLFLDVARSCYSGPLVDGTEDELKAAHARLFGA